ncbi:hypothetical protein Asp14428_30780 [Actinoplanes sp. NBRC 14428]|nr:hypothetical protein Asp14428_30780 [Actinoplanes sp. NBRC 14428]
MPQELQAQPLAGGRARDQPRHVRHREGQVAGLDDAQVRHQGGERVIGDLRLGGGDDRDQRRLAGRREADQADLGDALELQHHVEVVAGLAQLGEAGNLAPGVGQRGVAATAATAPGHLEGGARADQVGDDLALEGLDDRAVRDLDHQVAAVGAVSVVAHPAGAVLRLDVRAEVEVQQGVLLRVHHEDDAAAVAAVAAVGTAQRLELLAAYGDTPVATVTCLQVQHDPVDERSHFGNSYFTTRRAGLGGTRQRAADPGRSTTRCEAAGPARGVVPRRGPPARCGRTYSAATGTMLMVLRPRL